MSKISHVDRAAQLRRSDIERRAERVVKGLCGYCNSGRRIAKSSKSRCRTCLAMVDRANRRNPNQTPDSALQRSIRHKTGLPILEIQYVWGGRRGACHICETPAAETARGVLDFDHDHRTGAFRGWLCRACNQILGWLENYGDRIEGARAYLDRHSPVVGD